MCGFIASFGKYSSTEIIARTNIIKHRGPDDTKYLFDNYFGCGFVRLSIIDIDGGSQPIANEDNSIHLICNGEIYNYKDLANDLRNKGHIFKTLSDVEVILHLYEEYDIRCIDKLEGMYAFLIYDSAQMKILAGRDHIGIKPLFYQITEDNISFASELKAYDEKIFNKKVLIEKKIFGFPLNTSETIFKNVNQVNPGSIISINSDFRIREYAAEYPINNKSLEECLLSAVETHLINADVDVGVALSGGLDSSLIAALCKEIRPDIKTFVIADREDSEDIYYADLMAKKYGFDHTKLILRKLLNVPNLNYYLDYILNEDGSGAFDNVGDLAVFHFYKEVSKYVKVIISGDGADELFGGYWMHQKPLGFKDKLKSRSHDLDNYLDRLFPEDDELIGRAHVARILFNVALPNYHLWTLDRASMTFGVEARVPYLDLKVVNNVLKKDINKRIGKNLLTNLYKKYIPKEIISRKKKGFVDAINNLAKS